MRIKELAIKAGVNIQSIRFYERKGLLREPPERHLAIETTANLTQSELLSLNGASRWDLR